MGYQNKAARAGFNFVCPTFRPVAGLVGEEGKSFDINCVQMSEDATTSCNMQILDKDGGSAFTYYWVPKGTTGTKYSQLVWPENVQNGIWGVTNGKSGVQQRIINPTGDAAFLTVGQGIQIDAQNGNQFVFSGAVGEETVEFLATPTRSGFNYFGNPFPTDIDINNIQLSEDATTACNLQLLDKDGGMAVTYYWVPKGTTGTKYSQLVWPEDMEGRNGIWGVTNGKSGVQQRIINPTGDAAKIDAGQCVQIDAQLGNKFWVICPYDL